MKKTPESQTRANKKWNERNKDYRSYLNSRSSARSFIKNKATLEDIEELENLIEIRKKELNE